MSDQLSWLPDPLMDGIREQQARTDFFVGLAHTERDLVRRFRFTMAAVYSGRACVQLMIDAAADAELPQRSEESPDDRVAMLERELRPLLPYYDLIERIRIHDFHRIGLCPPKPDENAFLLSGPIALRAREGVAQILEAPEGPKYRFTGRSGRKDYRSLTTSNGQYYDENTRQYVDLLGAVKQYAGRLPAAVERFTQLRATPTDAPDGQ